MDLSHPDLADLDCVGYQDIYTHMLCPTCSKGAVLLRSSGAFLHIDGTDSTACWQTYVDNYDSNDEKSMSRVSWNFGDGPS
jgi:hypothetical protein